MADYWDSWDSNPANAKDCPTCGCEGKTITEVNNMPSWEWCTDCNGSGEVSPNQRQAIINDNKDEYGKD